MSGPRAAGGPVTVPATLDREPSFRRLQGREGALCTDNPQRGQGQGALGLFEERQTSNAPLGCLSSAEPRATLQRAEGLRPLSSSDVTARGREGNLGSPLPPGVLTAQENTAPPLTRGGKAELGIRPGRAARQVGWGLRSWQHTGLFPQRPVPTLPHPVRVSPPATPTTQTS